MATIYVRSTDGNNADSGATWALAKASLAGADGIDAAGDTIYVSQSHAEATAASVTWGFAGTLASQTKIICGNDGAAPPTAAATTATVSKTAAGALILNGAAYVYGITFQLITTSGAGDSIQFATLVNNKQLYESCKFILHTGISQFLSTAWATLNCSLKWKNCDVKFGNSGQYIYCASSLHWDGGSVLSGSTTVTNLFSIDSASAVGLGIRLTVENVDLSNLGTAFNVVTGAGVENVQAKIRNCKLPASWAGTLINAAFTRPARVEMHNCDSGATNYRLWVEDYYGQIRDETTLVRTGGASDGVTPLSWKMVSNANAVYPIGALASPEFVVYNTTTGSSKTVTVEILRDSATNLTDKEVWLEVSYLGTSGAPLGTPVSDCAADFVTTAADQTASSETWTTTGMANPNKQKLSVTFTPQMKGYFLCRVMLAKASTTIYVDPKPTVS